MSPGIALCEAGSRGLSAGGFCRAELAWREPRWISLRRARIAQAGLGSAPAQDRADPDLRATASDEIRIAAPLLTGSPEMLRDGTGATDARVRLFSGVMAVLSCLDHLRAVGPPGSRNTVVQRNASGPSARKWSKQTEGVTTCETPSHHAGRAVGAERERGRRNRPRSTRSAPDDRPRRSRRARLPPARPEATRAPSRPAPRPSALDNPSYHTRGTHSEPLPEQPSQYRLPKIRPDARRITFRGRDRRSSARRDVHFALEWCILHSRTTAGTALSSAKCTSGHLLWSPSEPAAALFVQICCKGPDRTGALEEKRWYSALSSAADPGPERLCNRFGHTPARVHPRSPTRTTARPLIRTIMTIPTRGPPSSTRGARFI